MVHKESLFVLKVGNYLMEMEFIEMTHQQFAMKLPNGKIQRVFNAGQVL